MKTVVFVMMLLAAAVSFAQSYYTGDGGKGIALAVLEPTGKALADSDRWILPLVQGSLNSAFNRYSAISIVDRQNHNKILAEQARPAFSMFGQQKNAASGNEKEREPFVSINAQFSYFPSFIQKEGLVLSPKFAYPYGFVQAPGYAIQVGMGLKLFNMVNALIDFGLDDPYMSEAMRIAGKIGTKYFDVMYIYKRTFFPQKIIDSTATLPSDEYDKWDFPQEGEKLEGKFNVGTLALMSPKIWGVFQLGFIWNSINANLGLQSEKEIGGRYIAYLDIDRNFNTYGFRIAMDLGDIYHFPSYNNGVLGKMKPIVETYIDLSWGNVNLSNEAADAVGFSSNKKLMTYGVIRGILGLAWEKKIFAKRSITYGLGLDFFSTSIKVDISSKNSAVAEPAVFGIFARIGLVL